MLRGFMSAEMQPLAGTDVFNGLNQGRPTRGPRAMFGPPDL
jgi:hypothetical protein